MVSVETMVALLLIDVAKMAGLISVASIPIAVSIWALLDVVHRDRWVWAFSGRRQIVWLTAIGFGTFTIVGGLMISLWYLLRIRPQLGRIERGDVG